MLTDNPPTMLPFLPVAAEIRPYIGEELPKDFSMRFISSQSGSVFLRLWDTASVTNSVGNNVLLSFENDLFSEVDDERQVTHEEIRNNIEKVCFDLKLSKSSLSEILGVSRQTIYDWLSGKNENFKPENLEKVEWLSQLSQNLDDDIKANLWLWRNKKLSNGITIKGVLSSGDALPQNLAKEINMALGKGKDVSRLVSKSQQAAGRDLVDKSAPFANND